MHTISNSRISLAGSLLAIASLLVSTVLTTGSAQAHSFTTLYSFCAQSGCTDGAGPKGPLIQATNGELYGTTFSGGANGNITYCNTRTGGCGTVFEITPSGKLTTAYSFCIRSNCKDGALPVAGLIQARNGDLYGTASYGGANDGGTIFRFSTGGTLTTVYSLCAEPDCADGGGPKVALVQGTDGNFYGTTTYGGNCSGCGYGTVYRLAPGGFFTSLYTFQVPNTNPNGLVQASDGNYYLTTHIGFFPDVAGQGTLYRVTPFGTLTDLYNFCFETNCADGYSPEGTLVQAADGHLYGTTMSGGVYNNGNVFKITLGGTLTNLYSFCADSAYNCADGSYPEAPLIQGSDGNFYGTTSGGGVNGSGTVFRIAPDGTLTTLYNFCSQSNCADGDGPGGLMQATNGDFYGTTSGGGANGQGTVFRLSMGLGPLVALQPAAGKVGAAVRILGTELTGVKAVTFNGTAAAFTVVSESEITTWVPAGATTGTVKVVTRCDARSSNVMYTVEPRTKTPVISLASGTYIGPQSVSITDGTDEVVIYYTTDGTSPATSSTATAYAGPMTVGKGETLKAIALGPDDEYSAVATAVYVIDL